MGRKKARIRYLVLGIICSAYSFLALIGIIWMLSRQPISEQNTAEYTATVTYVRHMNEQEDGPAMIYTEEYGDKITVNYFCDIADMRKLYSLNEGDEITFRITNDSIEFLNSNVNKVDVVSLRYDGYEILSLDDVIENIESGMIEVRIVLPIVFAVFTALAVLGYVIYARRTFVNNHSN